MKIQTNYWKNNSDDDKKERRAEWVARARREAVKNEESQAVKQRQTESTFKEETKFSGILEAATANTAQKIKQTNEDAGDERRDEEKDDRQHAARDKDSADNAAVDNRVERNASHFGGNFGGSGGFGGDINKAVHLSENFAARSILHIADLERMLSAVRKLAKPDGKREITLELKRSVLEGLKVKITAGDAAQVRIEFLAANEKIRAQIESHTEELAAILRGRGVNLQFLRVSLNNDDAANPAVFNLDNVSDEFYTDDSGDKNTFENNAEREV